MLEKQFGEGIIVGAENVLDKNRVVVPFSPALDLVLNGGIQEGSSVIITGRPKVGKTSSALDFAATAQRPEFRNQETGRDRNVYFFNVEGRLESRDLKGIPGLILDNGRFNVIQSKRGKILSAEEFIEIAETYIKTKPGDVFIIDSYSQLCTAGEMSAKIGDRYRADAPLLLARFCRRICNTLPVNDSIVIGITHRIANQGQGMSTWTEASGQKIQYACHVKLNALYSKSYMKDDTIIGQEIFWECSTSSLWSGPPPNLKTESLLRYGEGIDKAYELVMLGPDIGLIEKSGAWYQFPGGERAQGKEKAASLLREDKDLFDDLYSKFREMLGYDSQ